MSPHAKTAQSVGTRQPLEFRKRQGAIPAVLEGSLRSQEPLLRLLVNRVRKADTNVLKVILPVKHVLQDMEAHRDLQTA